ncbi:class I SAM-dependent methyltransferase [Brevibacillus invocatus]|uniref:Class I SAM-dependent methyltransferase n=1 Tax=Brevibacillus invocatus TaxID=173959 RepID=A0A3M8BUP0_9BACL|nr:class I SAM-dependent methyltransferase [Brevibacillus invocatus]MCM3080403.1 class I SAM-dependent methyltransferase [Brevibacillus invocatus]MCM3430517.1 class I SAM-dependent methyltransferase [Brevibacillus invocatus]RNB67033.1 class I SAM-dependent methyltransferase [Brevibacillus invocatus]
MSDMYRWADYYDLTQRGVAGDVEFYLEMAKKAGGPVLDLACGTGRISIPIAQAGVKVTGIDLSSDMLEKARAKALEAGVADNLKLLQGDMRKFQLEQSFSLIMIPFRSFLHLMHIHEQMKALTCIRKHLAPGGKFVMNVFVPKISHFAEESEKMSLRGTYRMDDGDELAMWDYTRYDHFQQWSEVTRIYERSNPAGVVTERVKGTFTLRYIFPAELHHLLRLNGLKVVERYGTFAKTPLDASSNECILVAEAL